MAWRSSGESNDALVSNMERFGVISSPVVEQSFRNVDRRLFVPKGSEFEAYEDVPIREGNVHISAPHIYGAVMEALDLPKDSCMSFLNAGSGTGYLTCLAASIMGPKSSHYCVELHKEVIEHFKEAVAAWRAQLPPGSANHQIEVFHGNAFEIDQTTGEGALGFDRIYIGAAIDEEHLGHFKRLLRPGGILVGPVDCDLVKIIRHRSFEKNGNTTVENQLEEYSQEILSCVRFAPLLLSPKVPTIIPSQVWSPPTHSLFPDKFREGCRTILLCARANVVQPSQTSPNLAAALPRALWMEIFTFMHRDWFDAPLSEVEFLRQRLREEQGNTERAEIARKETSIKCLVAELERDKYRLLAGRWKTLIRASVGRTVQLSEIHMAEVASASSLVQGEFGHPIASWEPTNGPVLRFFPDDDNSDDGMDEYYSSDDEHDFIGETMEAG
eukprot:Nitzschia sp. Nitz4//scaffold10_size219509//109914//111663//NITZ4_001431-RA/size219509-augustus-gene-0.246-mRNA-1//1//CDS//3329532929//5349//frame0